MTGEQTEYVARWRDTDENEDIGTYLLRLDGIAEEYGLENQQFYCKIGDPKTTVDTRTNTVLSLIEDEQPVDNVRTAYGDDGQHVLFEYDDGSFGDQYRLEVAGDIEFATMIESVFGQELFEKDCIDSIPFVRMVRDRLYPQN